MASFGNQPLDYGPEVQRAILEAVSVLDTSRRLGISMLMAVST